MRILALVGIAGAILLLVATFDAQSVALDVATPDPVATLEGFSETPLAGNPGGGGEPASVNVRQVLDGVPAGVGSVRSKGRERALLIALGIFVGLVLLVGIVRGAAGRLSAIGDSDIGEFLSQSWVTSVIAFVIGIGAAAAAYALDVSGSQAIYAAFAAALMAAVFASAGAVIRPGQEEENTTLRWLGAMTSGLIAAFLVISLVAASALALDPSLPSTIAGWVAEADEEPFLRAAFEDEVERLVLAVVVGTLFAALTVLLLRGIADSKRAASERRQLQQELERLRELIEGQVHGEREDRE